METEAKFVVPDDAAFARLLAAEQFGAYHRAKGRVAHVRDRYVDTPDRRFYHAGYAARVRSGDGGLLLTLKQLAGTVRNAVHAREEYEVTVPGLEIGGWPACEARDLAEKIADDRPLVDLVALEQTRNKAILQQDDRAVAEWSLDDVTIPTGSAPARFYELEVELLPDGNAADLATLATVFAVDYGLAPQPESKFERALHAVAPAKQAAGTAPLRHLPEASGHARPERVTTSLANGRPGRAEAGVAPEPADAPITPTDSMATAARKVLAAQYAAMQACEETAREGADPEGVHDMRVAVRRMRAALRVADPYLGGKAVKRVRQDLREIAHALGAVRDLDVLIKNAENFRDDLPDDRQTDLAPLLDAWKGARKRARKQLIRLLDSADYARFRKHMAAFLAEEDAPPAAEAASKEAAQAEVAPYQVRHVLASALWERYEAVRAYETVMADAAVPQLHALRITGKYLRYTLEFFRHVLPAEAGALIDDVVTLQDALGELHDADVAAGLIREHIAAAYPRRKKAPAPPPQPTARQALQSLGEQIRAARRQAKATERVGWGLFRDDVRRGRIIDLAGLALIMAIAVSIATSPDYEVQQVTVVNSKAITGEQAAHLTGILGTNIFMVDPAQVAARMRQSPFVKDASVETTLPDQVTIRVDERRPNVVWVLDDNTPYLISDDGVVMSKATTLQGYVVVYDQDTAPGKLHLGDKLERQDVIDVAQRLFMKLPDASGLHISQMEYQVAGGVTVVTDTGQRVRFGDGVNLDLKIREVAALVAQLSADKQAWRVIDARAPERLAVTK